MKNSKSTQIQPVASSASSASMRLNLLSAAVALALAVPLAAPNAVSAQMTSGSSSTSDSPSTTSSDYLTQPEQMADDKGNPLKFGSVLVYPSFGLRYGHDNNVTQAPDSGNKISSDYTRYSPGLKADYERRGDKYALAYQGEITRYNSSPVDDTENHTLLVTGNNILNSRNAINWLASYQDGFDARGSTDTPSAEPNRYRQQRYGGTYRYGAQNAKGRIEVDAFGGSKRYITDPANTDQLEYDTQELAMRFLVRVMPKTSIIMEVRGLDTDYVDPVSTRDSKETSYRVGATWTATAATSGTVKFGQTRREYDDPTRGKSSGNGWELNVNWAPRTYSRVVIMSSRAVNDTTGNQGDYVLNTTYGLKWSHNWVSYLRSELGVSRLKSEYAGDPRVDKQLTTSAGLYYDFRRWMSLGLEVVLTDRDSNEDVNDFDRRQTMAVVQVKF
jgi:hypothetical protein